ncbi:MAG: hypothetical protein AAF411_25755 [Myxococcota bacterium]
MAGLQQKRTHTPVVADDSCWPLLYMYYPADSNPDDQAFLAHTEEVIRAVHARHGVGARYVVLADLRHFNRSVNPSARRAVGELLNRICDDYGYPTAEAVVVRSQILRLMVTAVNFVQFQKKHERRAFPTLEQAHKWLIGEAKRIDDLTLPTSVPW